MMQRVPLALLRAGMVLAEPLRRRDGALMLPVGVVLTERHLELFPVWSIEAAVVETPDGPACHAAPAVSPDDDAPEAEHLDAARELLAARFVHADLAFAPTAALLELALPRAAALFAAHGPSALALPRPLPEASRPPRPETPPPGPMSVIESDPKLTSLPDVFVRINEVLNDPHSTAKEAAEAIGKDTSLSTKLLKVVNSAFYGFPVKVDTLSLSVTIVGSRQLTTLALGISVIALFKDLPGGLVDMRSFWKHSIACGVIASTLAGPEAGGEVERLFVAGLLHDMGRLVLYRNLPRHAAYVLDTARREGMLLREAERAWLGFDHAMLAGMLLRKWRFPESLEKAVRHHHGGLAHMSMPMPATVHVADAVAGALGIGSSGEIYAPPLSPAAWGVVGLAPERLADVVSASTAHIEEIAQVFLPDEA